MAQLEGLNVQLTADVKGLASNLKVGEDGVLKFAKTVTQLEAQLKSFQNGLKSATNPESVARLNRAIEATGDKIKAIKGFGSDAGDGLTKFSKSSNSAALASVNLGRVLQDAPFGFIGIANNLNPLLESFQRLGKESGGLGGALKALGSSMLGAGGIGLALSAFQFFALGGVDAIKKMFGALGENKAVAEARKEMDAFNKSLKDAEAGALATGLKLQSFVDIAKNGALPLSQRNEALKEANKILGEHGTKLTLANVATEAITKQTEMFTKALIAQAVAAKFTDRIADLTIEQAKAKKNLTASEVAYQKQVAKTNETLEKGIGGRGQIGRTGIQLGGELCTKRKEDVATVTSLAIQIRDLTENLNEATLAGTNLFGELGTRAKEGGKNVLDVLAELKKELSGLNALRSQGLLSSFELDSKSIDAYQKAIKEIAGIDAGSVEISKLGLTVNPIVIRNLIEEMEMKIKDSSVKLDVPVEAAPVLSSNFDATLNNLGIKILRKRYTDALTKAKIFSLDGVPIDFGNTTTERLKVEYDKLIQSQVAQSQALASIIYNSTLESFAGLGDAIAAGLSGANFGATLFSGLFQTLGAGLQAYGKQVIVASKLLIALQKVLPSGNFAGSLFVGIGLVALGGLTKNLGASLKLADGGFVSGKGTSRSDSIPAMLSNGEYVINAAAVRKFGLNNLDKINSLQGFAAGGVIGVPQPYAVPNNNVNISNSGIVVAVEGEFKMRNDVLALAVKKGNKTVSINA